MMRPPVILAFTSIFSTFEAALIPTYRALFLSPAPKPLGGRLAFFNATLLPNPRVFISKRGYYPAYNETQEAEESLEWFFGQLKTFIRESYFEAASFERVEKQLEADFRDISNSAQYISPYNPVLFQQLRFCRRVFETMQFTVREFSNYSLMTNTSQFLLNSLVELNVRVLGLCDSHGMLDVDVPGYSEKLYGFWRNMCSWTEHFQSLEGVAEDIRDLFLDQKIEVEENIENLWGQVP